MSDTKVVTPVEETTEFQVVDPKEIQVTSKPAKALQLMVDEETEKRSILTAYISKHMKDGVDYGKIHIVKDCANKYNCKNEYHFSKASLFKPGAEKFSSLMQLKALYEKDEATWQMLGSQPGLICFVCKLVDGKGVTVGEGRGAASVAEKGSPNVAIKLAEKRAKVDAVLSTGGLSDFFTQDLEDMNFDAEPSKSAPQQRQTQQPRRPAPAARPAKIMSNIEQRRNIMSLVALKGQTTESLKDYFLSKFQITTAKSLTYDQAEMTIKALKELPDPATIGSTENYVDGETIANDVPEELGYGAGKNGGSGEGGAQ